MILSININQMRLTELRKQSKLKDLRDFTTDGLSFSLDYHHLTLYCFSYLKKLDLK